MTGVACKGCGKSIKYGTTHRLCWACYSAGLRLPLADRFWARVAKGDSCWEWTGVRTKPGYGVLTREPGGGPRTFAHRISWELHFFPIPPGMVICHACDNPPCVNPGHLMLGLPLANAVDATKKGHNAFIVHKDRIRVARTLAGTPRQVRGVLAPKAKLDEDQVREIRRLAAAGMRFAEIARLFEIRDTSVSAVVRRLSWKHVA